MLAPASLVGQWREELETKFGIACATTHDPLLRDDAARVLEPAAHHRLAFRRAPATSTPSACAAAVSISSSSTRRIICATASSQSWKLVDALNKRFLLLLSATPVQNDLIELYNLLTLLKPGIFKTLKEFRSRLHDARASRASRPTPNACAS